VPAHWRFPLFPVGVLKVIALICLAFVCLWAIALSLLSAVGAGGMRAIEIGSMSPKTISGCKFDAQKLIVLKIKDQVRKSILEFLRLV
jgi:hypothetical protein